MDIIFAVEQAAAAVISSKIDKVVSADTTHSIIINGADELANTATGVAFGSPVDLTSLAGNMVGDEVGEEADYYGKQIKLQASNDPSDSHKKPTPTSYANSIQSTQNAPAFVRFVSQSK